MRAALRALMSGILASVAGLTAQTLVLAINPASGPIAPKCIGIAAFALVLLACLIVLELQAREG